MKLPLIAMQFAFLGTTAVLAFVPKRWVTHSHIRSSQYRLFGIHEWREQALQKMETISSYHSPELCNVVTRPVPIHLMDSKRVALLGETVYLQFTQYNDVLLFQQAIDNNEGVFGLGFVENEDDVLYDKISLVEIKDYNMIGGSFGVFLACQVVGNALVLDTDLSEVDNTNKKQPPIVLCSEITNRVESMSLVEASVLGKNVETLIAQVYSAEKARVGTHDEDDDDRWKRYHEAYHATFQSDSNGYTFIKEEPPGSQQLYSWKQLNAISWAAFSTSQCLQQDHPYRLAALDNDSTTNRLLLASYWLGDVLHEIKQGTV